MKWLHFILSHSFFIALCAVAMAFQTTQLLHLNHNLFVYGFIFFATTGTYNFYWILSKIYFNKKTSVTGVLKNETTEIYLIIISATGVAFCLLKSAIPLSFVFTAILFTGIYSLSILPFVFLQFTNRAGVLKTIILAITWAYVTAFLPLQKNYLQLDQADLFVITRQFLFMLMLCIIFDSRDIAVDKLRGLRSLATELEPAILRLLVYIIFTVLFVTNFLFMAYGISFYQSLALQVSTLALLAVYFFSTKKQGYLFYYFVVDGMMLFSALATYIAGI